MILKSFPMGPNGGDSRTTKVTKGRLYCQPRPFQPDRVYINPNDQFVLICSNTERMFRFGDAIIQRNRLKCPICEKSFKVKRCGTCAKYWISPHPKAEKFNCRLCRDWIRRESIKFHLDDKHPNRKVGQPTMSFYGRMMCWNCRSVQIIDYIPPRVMRSLQEQIKSAHIHPDLESFLLKHINEQEQREVER